MIDRGNPAAMPVWTKGKTLIIPSGTADASSWMDATAVGGATAGTTAIKAGVGRRWCVEGLHVTLSDDTAQAGGVEVFIESMTDTTSTVAESIPFKFFGRGSYVVPVAWAAYDTDKYLRIRTNNDATISMYVRAFGVRSSGPETP